ncbi:MULTISPECIES: CHAT domain-containing protein [unclassified Streptomyces]|uniref:CHAT domain-containing tetratricopeptide repeat protein n=1 Tax=unclassified Streptomyces TaxID=2593676 RepID=UPI0036692936
MAQVGREHFVAVVEELTARWLQGSERELPVRTRAELIGERALDSYESAAPDGALPDALAALGAADALGSNIPALRQRLGHLSDAARYARPQNAELQDRSEPDVSRLDELHDLLRVQASESRTAYRALRPSLETARGYESEALGFALLVYTCQLRDALDTHLEEVRSTPPIEHIQLSPSDRARLLQCVRTRASGALNQAVDGLQTAVDASTNDGHPRGRSYTLGDLAQALLLRYEALKRPSDLEHAVSNARAAARLARSVDDRDLSLVWTGVLGVALRMRHDADGDSEDLKAAADALWKTKDLNSLSIERGALNGWLRAVGAVQRYYYAISHEVPYLEKAFETHLGILQAHTSLDLRDARGTSPSAVYASFGYSCLTMCEHSAEPDLLGRAVHALDSALDPAASEERGPVEWTEWTGALATALRLLFERQGDSTSLERLVTVLTLGLKSPALPESSPDRTRWRKKLGEALLRRYELIGAATDLHTARGLLSHAPSDALLAAAHYAEYLRASDLRALDSAVLTAVAAVRTAVGPEGAHLPAAFQLAQCLLARADVLRAPDDARHAADLLKHCLGWSDQPAEQLALQTVEYGHALLTLYEARTSPVLSREGGDPSDISTLETAVVTLTEVLVNPGPRERVKARAASLLEQAVSLDRERRARSLRRAENDYDSHLDAHAWRQAHAALEERATDDRRPHRPRATHDLRGDLEAIRDELHHRVVDVVMEHPDAGPVVQARLVTAKADVLAHWCLEAGEIHAALEVTESGRAVLAAAAAGADVIGDRIALRALSSLQEQGMETRVAIDAAEVGRLANADPRHALPEAVSGRSRLPLPENMRESVRAALRDVIPAPTAHDIAEWCGSLGIDAVVHLFAGRHCGWALITLWDGRIASLRLPLLRLNATELVHFTAAHDSQLRVQGTGNPPDDLSRRTAIRNVCDWAWKAAIGALHEHLATVGIEGTPRVAVIPPGPLGLVPWHAARHRVKEPGGWGHRFAIESMAFTYAPSARALSWYAFRALLPLTGSGVVVVDPTRDLPHARQEGEDVYRWYYSKGRRFSGSGEPGSVPATPRAVLSALSDTFDDLSPAYPVAHFACHARSLALANESHLVLANEQRLSVATVLDRLRWDSQRPGLAPLVVLSACATAVPGAHYDSALSLATAFGAAGAAAVVGSLWAVDDATTAALMRDFHTLLNLEGLPPAEALRTAQLRALREARARARGKKTKAKALAGDPSSWAAFVHQGLGNASATQGSVVSSAVARLPESEGSNAGSAPGSPGLRLPIFASLPGPDPSAIVWKCPLDDCIQQADGDMDSPFDADCCPSHPDNAFILA